MSGSPGPKPAVPVALALDTTKLRKGELLDIHYENLKLVHASEIFHYLFR